jgi:hypothetical protein
MAVTLNASTSSGLVQTADTSGVLTLQSNGTNALSVSSSNLQFNSGYGSVATAYGCRAWVNFNGTGTPAIRASGNVSSITDNGTGDYTVNFTTAMPDANYAAVGMTAGFNASRGAGAITYQYRSDGASGTFPQTTSCAFKTWDQADAASNAVLSDWSLISATFFR